VADPPALQAQLSLLEQDAGAAGFWDDARRAQALMSRINGLRGEVQALRSLQGLLEEAEFAVELLEDEVGGRWRSCWRSCCCCWSCCSCLELLLLLELLQLLGAAREQGAWEPGGSCGGVPTAAPALPATGPVRRRRARRSRAASCARRSRRWLGWGSGSSAGSCSGCWRAPTTSAGRG
jgi:hypothetical protein